MSVEAADIKQKLTLRALLERDGIALRKSGATLVCCCPIHNEKTPSFQVHEKADGDWFKCFGCGAGGDIFSYWAATRGMSLQHNFAEILEALAGVAGIGLSNPAPLPKREFVADPADQPIAGLGGDDVRKWERAAMELYTDPEELRRIAEWRGIRLEVIEWAARRLLMGVLVNRGAWREAFVIQRPVGDDGEESTARFDGLEAIGWHVRLAPRSRSNDADKASWRYEPRKGLGAWPFVVLPGGGIADAKYLFYTEGQWDGLALIDLMGWDKAWPKGVAVFGMRGATSWKKAMEFDLRPDAVAFLIADRDVAGEGWFVRRRAEEPAFAEVLGQKVRQTFGFWPAAAAGPKDLNDVVKGLDENGRRALVAHFRGKIEPREKKRERGPTFHVWLKKRSRDESEIGRFARKILSESDSPRGRIRRDEWWRFVEGLSRRKIVAAASLSGVEEVMTGEQLQAAFIDAWQLWSKE